MAKQVFVNSRLMAVVLTATLIAILSTSTAKASLFPGCGSTLQDCINTAGSSDTVTIESATPINESITINKSLTLAAADGYDAVFGSGYSITIDVPDSGAADVTLQRLTLMHGHVQVNHNSSTDSTYSLSQLLLKETDAPVSGNDCVVNFAGTGTGTAHFILGDSRLEIQQPQSGGATPSGVCASGYGSTWQVDFFRNHVRAGNGLLASAFNIYGANGGVVTVDSNQVLGSVINILQGQGSASNTLNVQNNMVAGYRVGLPPTLLYGIEVTLDNSALNLVNNTSVNNHYGMWVQHTSGDAGSSGVVANNLVAFNQQVGLEIDSTSVTNEYNLVYGNTQDNFIAGPHTVMGVDPMLASIWNPRLTISSPAIDAGSNTDAPSFLFFPAYDADGELRIVNGTVDIGAFEWNLDYAVAQDSTSANMVDGLTYIGTLPDGLDDPYDRLLVTPQHDSSVASTQMAALIGVYETSSSPSYWSLYSEDGTLLSAGRRFSVLVPRGDGIISYTHSTTSANVEDSAYAVTYGENASELDNSALNNLPSAIAFVTHSYDPGGVFSGSVTEGDSDLSPLGLFYYSGNWYIDHEDGVAVSYNEAYNIAIAPLGSPNAFTASAGSAPTNMLQLSHPMLDGNECAIPFVARTHGTFSPSSYSANTTPFSVHYANASNGAPGHWSILAEGPGSPTFPAGASFNVMVQGAQANACRDDKLFTDGFESFSDAFGD